MVFLFSHTVGNPVNVMLPDDAPQAVVEAVRERMGFNDPLHVQFGRYIADLLRGDLGVSLRHNAPNAELIMSRLPATLVLASVAMGVAALSGTLLGLIAALRRNTAIDRLAITVSTLGVTSIDFWVALMLIIVVSLKLRWLPTSGYGELHHIILPALVISFRPMGRIAQVTRATSIEEFSKPYVLALRARGLPEWRVMMHGARNAGIVLLTMTGYEFVGMINGSAIVESVFGWPGVGFLTIQAVRNGDWPLIVSVALVVGTMVTLLNWLVDVLYSWLDPRVRLE
jgi:peptide/nickel transport system permease protein